VRDDISGAFNHEGELAMHARSVAALDRRIVLAESVAERLDLDELLTGREPAEAAALVDIEGEINPAVSAD
jgi:hypothetical protein